MRMRSMARLVAVTLVLSLALPMAASTAAAAEEQHWVYKELKDYKQRIVDARNESLAGKGPVTPEEWTVFQAEVLDAQKLNQPITPDLWATMLKLSVRLPKDQTDSLIAAYVHGLLEEGAVSIPREIAVGGMVKLLTIETIQGEWRAGGARDAVRQLEDYKEMDDRQSGLVAKAFRDNVLDATVKAKFRPKDKLTHAEAISMMDRVIHTYQGVTRPAPAWPQAHWSAAEIANFLNSYSSADNITLTAAIQRNVPKSAEQLNQPVPIELWHLLLLSAARLPADLGSPDYNVKFEDYTLHLADGAFIDRSHAVIGLVKLGGPNRDSTRQELEDMQKAFTDVKDASDPSVLAVAYREGLIGGYGDGTLQPHNELTYGEAFAIAVRLSIRGVKP